MNGTASVVSLNWVDFVIIGIIAISAIVSLIRGFVREALSLGTWIIALWVAFRFAQPASVLFEGLLASTTLRVGAAFASLLLAVLLLGSIINYGVGRLVEGTGLTGTDRLLGMLFGVARGAALVLVLVILGRLTPVPNEPWWQQSALVAQFEQWSVRVIGLLPPEVARSFGAG